MNFLPPCCLGAALTLFSPPCERQPCASVSPLLRVLGASRDTVCEGHLPPVREQNRTRSLSCSGGSIRGLGASWHSSKCHTVLGTSSSHEPKAQNRKEMAEARDASTRLGNLASLAGALMAGRRPLVTTALFCHSANSTCFQGHGWSQQRVFLARASQFPSPTGGRRMPWSVGDGRENGLHSGPTVSVVASLGALSLLLSVSFFVKWVRIRMLRVQGSFLTFCYLNSWDSKTG